MGRENPFGAPLMVGSEVIERWVLAIHRGSLS
jgi:hypothetical protein